jgi:hypothetical protein
VRVQTVPGRGRPTCFRQFEVGKSLKKAFILSQLGIFLHNGPGSASSANSIPALWQRKRRGRRRKIAQRIERGGSQIRGPGESWGGGTRHFIKAEGTPTSGAGK